MSGEPEEKYAYVCEDQSVLYPVLKKHLWAHAMRFVPAWSSPNTLTLLGNASAWVAFVVLLILRPSDSRWFLAPAFFNFLYLSFDNMDGMQARRAGRSSPLGEFLDHWSDAFNTAIFIFGYGLAMKCPPWVVVGGLSLVSLAYFSCFWEQQVTGKLQFGKVGSLEGVLFVCSMYVLVALFGHARIATAPLVYGISFSNLLMIGVNVGFVFTTLAAMLRVKRRLFDFLPQTVVYAAVFVWQQLGAIPLFWAGAIVALTAGYLGGRAVVARVLREPYKGLDPILFVVLAGAMVASIVLKLDGEVAACPVVIYLAARLVGDFYRTVSTLRHHLVPNEVLGRVFVKRG